MSKEVLAVDFDEVLFPFMPEYLDYHNAEYGTTHTPDDFFSYEFEKVMHRSQKQITDSIMEFVMRDNVHVAPIKESAEAIKRLSERFELVVVTARERLYEARTREWLDAYFEGLIGSHNFLGHYVENIDKPRTKVSVCQELGARALIDDSATHVSLCVEAGVGGVLFGDYPWNRDVYVEEGVVRCNDWTEVEKYFES